MNGVKNLPEHVRDHLLVAMHTQVVDLVFGVTQGVAKYTASPSNMQTVNDVTNIYNTLAVDLGLALTIHPSEAIIKVMHLKKLIEDYIITQITSVLDHDIFTKTLIERYSSHKQSDESFLSVVERRSETISLSMADFAFVFQNAEQGYYSALRRQFDFWLLTLYALECTTLDDFMTLIDDSLLYDIDPTDFDSTILYLGLEYFYTMLFNRYLAPAFDVGRVDFDHTSRIKVIGKDGLVIWINVS